jgi:hypothetical protein
MKNNISLFSNAFCSITGQCLGIPSNRENWHGLEFIHVIKTMADDHLGKTLATREARRYLGTSNTKTVVKLTFWGGWHHGAYNCL